MLIETLGPFKLTFDHAQSNVFHLKIVAVPSLCVCVQSFAIKTNNNNLLIIQRYFKWPNKVHNRHLRPPANSHCHTWPPHTSLTLVHPCSFPDSTFVPEMLSSLGPQVNNLITFKRWKKNLVFLASFTRSEWKISHTRDHSCLLYYSPFCIT